jgi:ferredoxin
MKPRNPIILSRHESPNAKMSAVERGVIDYCLENGRHCLCIPHVYHWSESCELWKKLAEDSEISCFLGWISPRPTHWLLKRHGIDCNESKIFNLNDFPDAKAAVAAISSLAEHTSQGKVEELAEEIRPRWYPVIDGSRCVNCQHCLQFCLFGVYELDAERKVLMRNPDLCKSGCPACSRICPQSAIMFPLYEKDDAIAGAPGQYVSMDAAARKMFYTRTKKPCPVCGRKAERKSSSTAKNLCPECGRPVAAGKTPQKSESREPLPFDDLDKLVDQLDREIRKK